MCCDIDHRDMDKQLTIEAMFVSQKTLCLSHKRRLASNTDVGFYCVNIMTTSFSSPERIVWTIMSGIITVTRLMSSLGIKDHWVKWIYLWFIHTLYAKRTRWNYMYIYQTNCAADYCIAFRVWPHGDRRLYRLGIKVDYGGMDERYAMNKTTASRLNDPCSVIAASR